MAMTPGANRTKQTQIYRMMSQGFSAKQISAQTKVYLVTVEKFMKHFKNPKNLPKTMAMSAIKDGMPDLKSVGTADTSGVERELARTMSANEALTARIEALEAVLAPPAEAVTPVTDGIGEDPDGLG